MWLRWLLYAWIPHMPRHGKFYYVPTRCYLEAARRILHDHVTNISIQESTRLLNLPLVITDHRHALLGHISLASPEASTHRALQLCIDVLEIGQLQIESSTRCRPRRKWLYQLDEDLWSLYQCSLRRCPRPDTLDCLCACSLLNGTSALLGY